MADNNNNKSSTEPNTSNRGFAGMDDEQQREIASKGGKSQGKESNPGNFANNPERAAEAGRKGGQSRGSNDTADNLNG